MYLSYDEYQNMGGTLEEATFNEYEFTAECTVDWYTFNRLKKESVYPTVLPRVMYELIHLIQIRMDALTNNFVDANGNVASGAVTRQSNDGVTLEFNNLSSNYIIEYTKDKQLGDIVRKYLSGVKNSLGQSLTYRGLYPGE